MSSVNKSKRARYCVAPGCTNYECALKKVEDDNATRNQQNSAVTYHNFPTKLSLRNKWFKFVGYHKKGVSSLTWRTWTICSEHFEDSEFEENCHLQCIDGVYKRLNIKLKNGAVPTKSKLLPPTTPQSSENDVNKSHIDINTNSIDFTTPTPSNTTEIINNNNDDINSNINLKNEYNEIDFDNETIYTEIDEDFHSKCGEVFVTRKGIFLYFCIFCNENLENSHQFIKHIYKEHLSLDNDIEEEINNKNINDNNNINIKNEEIIKLSPSKKNTIKVPLPLQHCEIVENESGNFETISFFDYDDEDKNNSDQNIDNEINQNLYAEIQAKKMDSELFKKPKVELQKNNMNSSLLPTNNNDDINDFIDLTDDNIENNMDFIDYNIENNMENNIDNDIEIINDDDKISIKNEAIIDNRNVDISNLKINNDKTIFTELNNDIINNDNYNNSTINNIISKNCLIKNTNPNHLDLDDNNEIPNCSSNNNEILPAAYNDKEFVEADDDDDDDIGNELDEDDDDWYPVSRKQFKCKYCPKILKSQCSLTIHIRSHTGERPFKCHTCSRTFKSQGILYNHEKIHTGVKMFLCNICGLYFSTQYTLNIHAKRHETQQNQYKCAYCDKMFLRLKKKVLHQRTHNVDIKHEPDEETNILTKNFKCEFCLKVLKSQYSLIEHRRIHTGEKPYPCKFCPSAFRSKLVKICHERSNHTGERPFSCIYCDKAFVTKSTRDNHERTHTKERPFKCDLCDKTYRQASAKYIHMKTHFQPKIEKRRKRSNSANGSCVGDNNKIYQCEYCQKILSSQNVLNEHRRIHTGEKPFSCNHCPMKFRAKSLLFYHVQIHTGEKRFECKYCYKRFRLAGNMVAHLRTHTGEKPFRCTYCDKSFCQKQSKMIHEKTHIPGYKKVSEDKEKENKERVWKCDMCGKILLNKYTLTNHIRTHTGERPYKCSYCPSAFKSLSEQYQHERIHSGVKPYKCIECEKAFKTKSQLNMHYRRHAAKKLKLTIHKCNICDKEFKFNSNLIIHQRCHRDKCEI